ncbi:hypothetical protein [Rathayibacter caricis]|uniref:hypothetical protein n=1 Tax=Rathayibacter caricis TaxID=110936 RepID=UPI0011B21E1B|nr:hypothetical protein [Rathayibacter caricis]
MARAIFRASINGPTPNNKQAELSKVLLAAHFRKIGTASYEGEFARYRDALAAVSVGIAFLNALPNEYELDHLWTYVDRT